MTDVAYPIVYDSYLELAEDALGSTVRVVDGYDISEDPGDVLLMGVPNLSDVSAISAGQFEQEQVGHGASGYTREVGSLNGVVMAWNGEGDAPLARSTAFGYLASLAAAVREDRSLGVSAFNLVVGSAIATGDVAEDKVDGATCAVSFTVNYTALLG